MEGNDLLRRNVLFALFVILILCTSTSNVSSQGSNLQVIQTDDRITGVVLDSEQTYSQSWDIKKDEWYSVDIDCLQCSASIMFNDSIVDTSSSQLVGKAAEDGIIKLMIETTDSEQIGLSIVHNVSDNFQTIRPAPGILVDSIPGGICEDINLCIDVTSDDLSSIPNGEFNSSGFITGVLDNDQPEYFVIDNNEAHTMELSLFHSSSDIKIEVIKQNDSVETFMSENLTSPSKLSTNEIIGPKYWHFESDERAIIKVQSQSPNTVWAIQRTIFNSPSLATIAANSSHEIYGHYSKSLILDVIDAQRLVLNTPSIDITCSYKQLIDGNWLDYGVISLTPNIDSKLYVQDGANAIRLDIYGPVFLIKISTEDYSDINSGLEAPSLMPQTKLTDNSSWPLLNIDDSSYIGQFTLPIFDHSDVYKIEITGWEDSIHFVNIIVEGDINDCEIELIEKNQDNWEDEETKIRTVSSNRINAALELERGTHFLRISIINSSLYENSWGEDVSPKKYTITTQYELVDEGEEPWYPPDDNALKWGNIARWFLGGILLIPALYVFISYQQNAKFANSLLEKKKRLEWLRTRLDRGESTPRESRKFLNRALDSISSLEWEDACQMWGDYDLEHRTDGLALVAWNIDERLSKDESSWPMIIGINILQGDWELAALRLDAPQGEPWTVTNVHPRFLASGEEVFLDTMAQGNKIFLTVEVKGKSMCVDIEINGRVNGEPFAARIPKTLWRGNNDGEE